MTPLYVIGARCQECGYVCSSVRPQAQEQAMLEHKAYHAAVRTAAALEGAKQ